MSPLPAARPSLRRRLSEKPAKPLGRGCASAGPTTSRKNFFVRPGTFRTQAAVLAPARESLVSGKPIPWRRVKALPDYVYFDHSIHLAKGIGCTTCHGQVDQMPLTLQAEPMTMGWCIDCHRNPAPYLRKPEDVFADSWSPPPDQNLEGRKLMTRYEIDTTHLTDCSVCHR